MSTSHDVATASTYPGASTQGSALSRGRITTIAAALALGAGTVAAMLLWNPWPARDELSYGAVAPLRDNTWLGMTLDGLGLAVTAFALSLTVCILARHRGAVWATVGSIITSSGGLLFAMGAFAFAAFSWYATEPDAISTSAGAELMKHAADSPERIMGLQMAGFLLFTIGIVMLSVALLRAGTVPRPVPVALLVLTVLQFAPVPGRVLDLIQVALMAVLIALAALLVRAQWAVR
jgi:hypothetical protein